MSNGIINRFDEYMHYKGLNDNQVTVQCGLSNGAIGKARINRKGINSQSIEKILSTYKDLDARWLLTGEGEMLGTSPVQADSDTVQILKNQNKELIDTIQELNRELGDKERQLIELKKERAQHLTAAENADAVSYGLAK